MIPKRHRWLPLLLLSFAACTPAPERVVEARTSAEPAPRGSVLLRTAMLSAQNRERAGLGLAPLAWSDRLAASARTYAETMARTGRFEHAPQSMGLDREGENLWTGTRGAYRYDEMVAHWLEERRNFVNLPVPQFSRTGRWQDVSHYGQIASRRTTEVGCALASSPSDDYLVCRYAPPGNLFGVRVY